MIRIHSFLSPLYGDEKASYIQKELVNYLSTLKKEKYRENLLWYKTANIYTVYPDAIGGKHKKHLDNLIDFLPHIKKIGFQAIHVLPFMSSPMKDRGFDVSDYYTVRKSLGSLSDIQRLKHAARKLGLRVFMDLVFNHVSIKHEWFMRAIQGEEKYRNYFIHTKERPKFIRKIHKDSAVIAEYIVNGQKKLVNIAFPELTGEIPHWRHEKDGYWYYHTYRIDQIDIDWRNPDVFLECAKVLIFWTTKGFHFRLDAIPFIGKSAYKQINTKTNFTNHLLAALNHIAKQVNPECAFILETYEHIDTVINYLGKKNLQQAEMLYGFHLCTSLWVSILKEDTSYIWETLLRMKKIPTFAQWINFLRNHDELSLAYLDEKTLRAVEPELLKHGESFREGYGIAGRTFSFLGEKKDRFLMSYLLLLSMPGGVMIPYGDEYAKKNSDIKEVNMAGRDDVRNINRGALSEKFQKENATSEILSTISHMLHVREGIRFYFNVWPIKEDSSQQVFRAIYDTGNSSVRTIVNLTQEEKTVNVNLKGYTKILDIGSIGEKDNKIILGPYAGVWLQK